jgi:5'-phosphate synthase pdxT subunit
MANLVGILALQGCLEPHQKHLHSLQVESRLVSLPEHLAGIQGLILPGGESTTMIKLAKLFGLWEPLKEKAAHIPFWGVCAGSILMANQVENPSQESLGVMDVRVRRNAYGRQLESFQGVVDLLGVRQEPAVFIRAPKFVSWGETVKVAGTVNQEAAFLDNGRHMVTAFHPELTDSSWFHQIFLQRANAISHGLPLNVAT